MGVKEDLISMLNHGLELEHAARIQYLAHAELIKGETSEKIIERLQEIASDEEKHEKVFRTLIGDYLFGEPIMGMSETHKAHALKEILEVNLKDEKTAIDFYKQTYQKIVENKDELQYEFERLEHDLRHIILDEEEHVAELLRLSGI